MAFGRKKQPLTYTQALNYSLRLLQQRSYTEYGIRQKLTQQNVTPEDSDHVIEHLTRHRLIDDKRYAQSLIRTQANYRHASTNTIRQKLFQKGVDRELANAELSNQEQDIPNEQERAIYHAERFWNKHIKRGTEWAKDRRLAYQKIAAHLFSKGFSPSTVREAIDTVLHNFVD